MTALHPGALAGLVAAIMPLAIYLLLRRRKTEIQWGAGYLLRLALASKKKSSLWRQWVVLLVRCLILALAACLIAQPFRAGRHPSTDTPAVPERAVHRVVLFDNSRSMTVSEDNLTRLDRARLAAGALLRSERPGDTIDIIPLIPPPGAALEPITLSDAIDSNHVEHALASIPVRDGAVALAPALSAAMARLSTASGAAGEIYLFSDFPRELESQLADVDWFAPLAKERGIRVAPVNMVGLAGGESEQNVCIDDITLGTDLVAAAVPTRLYINAVNNSDREAIAAFDIAAGAVSLAHKAVRINPDERKRIAIPITLSAGSGQVLTVSVHPTRLISQATRALSVDVRDALEVWLVADEKDPGADSDGEPDDTEFFQRAVREEKGLSMGVHLRTAHMNDLTTAIPSNVDAIILAGPRYTTPAIAKPLSDFVRKGGGLIITASPALHLPAFNENLGAFLPALLDKPMREKIDPEAFLMAQVEASDSKGNEKDMIVPRPLFEEFSAQDTTAVASDFPQARYYNHYLLKDAQALPGVILRLSNGDPLLIEKRFGRGHVLFYASTLGVGWTSQPVRQSYIPLLARMLDSAVAGRALPLNIKTGTTFITPWPASTGVTLTLPDLRTRSITPLESASGRFIVLDDLTDAGLYQLADGAGHRRAFTVSGAAAETDLRSLPPAARSKLAAALGAEIFPDWSAAVKTLGPAGATSPLWPWLLVAMLALYVFEAWFVRTV